ncbi:MAG: DUF1501 domain-containing protein [Alphaproteobacteria bacterium]|nr:MAG: DUF1501 domain-containing protein [Alphaproteobacteria bacterium]
MTEDFPLSRRGFLGGGLALGCSAAASPLITPVALARAPGENRLVVIILRGAMDGLDLVRPMGEKAFATMRPTLLQGARGHDLDGFFTLHPAMTALAPLWKAGELAFVHAVSTPYRGKRSHFDGQDLLENGGYSPDGSMLPSRDGWLNRAVGLIPGADMRTAFSVGQENMLLLDGKTEVSSWTPDAKVPLSAQARTLLEKIYTGQPVYQEALHQALMLADEDLGDLPARRGVRRLAAYAATQLNRDTRIAAFSIGGWDTHRAQEISLKRAMDQLSAAVLALHKGLGANWKRTAVVAVTEFGRTARENGSRGTDHGTGGAMLLAGGALSGAKVHGEWPGLGPSDLLEDRDLRPTQDVRRSLGWLLRGLYGLDSADIERVVFPHLDMGADPGLLA